MGAWLERYRREWGDPTALASQLLASAILPIALRRRGLRALGHTIASTTRIYPGSTISGHRLDVGPHTFINSGCILEADAPLVIGTGVHLARGVQITTATHDIADPERRAGTRRSMPVTIGDGCWIGAGAIVLPGVEVARGCVIAAGAVVTRDCAPDGLYAGVPARRLRSLS